MSFFESGSMNQSTISSGSWLNMAVPAVCSNCGLVFDMKPLLRDDSWYKPHGRVVEAIFGSSGVVCVECLQEKVDSLMVSEGFS